MALEVRDLDWGEQGVRITIRRSKTDQEGVGAVVAVPEGRSLTPLTHLRAWLAASGITAGPVFRPLWKGGKRVRDAALSDHAVARILQARVQTAGFDPARYGGHSLRAGFVTAAARAAADVWKIQQVSMLTGSYQIAIQRLSLSSSATAYAELATLAARYPRCM